MLTRLIARVRGIAARRRASAESAEELAFHVEHETAANIARGLSPAAARRAALGDLGGLTQTAEQVRGVRTTWVDLVRQDSAYAWRRFARDPGLVAAAVLTFGLGIGGTTAAYTVVYGVLMRLLPVADEDSVAVAYRTDALTNSGAVSFLRFEAWRRSEAFVDLAALSPLELDLIGTPGAERVSAAAVSDNFFGVLGVRAAIGRVFSAADREAPQVPAVISDSLWRRRFGADPAILGTALVAGDLSAVIVGVMPRGFERWRGEADVWLPIERTTDAEILTSPGYEMVTPIGRLASTASLSGARSILDATPDPGASFNDGVEDGASARIVRLRDDVVPPRIGQLLAVVFAAMLLAWLVVCANLSMLLLAQGARRRRELAVRLALGASRRRVCAQLLTESTWLVLAGGVLGVGLAAWGVRLFLVSGPPALFDATAIRLDAPVLGFAVALTAVTAILSGLAPALQSSRPRTALIARQAHGTARARLAHVLIVSQIAVALVVLTGASLLVRSLVRMQDVDLGFDIAHVLMARVSLPESKYGGWSTTNVRHVQVQRELVERASSIPVIEGVTVGDDVFAPGVDSRVSIALDDGRRLLNGQAEHHALVPGRRYVGPDYMRLHGIRVIAGRELRRGDDASAPSVVLVNSTMAALYWPGESALGHRINLGRRSRGAFDEPWTTVVGVVADVRHGGVDLPVKPEIYLAQFQHPRPAFGIVVRATGRPEQAMSAVRGAVRAFDPDILLFGMRPVADVVAGTTATARYSSTLLSGLAGMVVLLCGVGIFSLLAGSVASRRREIAIRMALGAVPRRTIAMVVGRAAVLLVVGVSIGAAAAAVGAHALSGLLYDVAPLDPIAHSIGVIVLVLVGVAAAWIPARRASLIEPVVALREE